MTSTNTSTETVTTAKGFKFDVYPDASGFTGTLNVGGDLFAVNYTDRVNVDLVSGKSGSKPARWKANWARKIAGEFAATLPAEWHDANREMYAA
jgi:hypothetical protein